MIHGLACSIKFWMHAGRWEITRGGRSRGKVGDHAGRWENTRKAYLPTSQVHPYCNSMPHAKS